MVNLQKYPEEFLYPNIYSNENSLIVKKNFTYLIRKKSDHRLKNFPNFWYIYKKKEKLTNHSGKALAVIYRIELINNEPNPINNILRFATGISFKEFIEVELFVTFYINF